MLAVLGIVFLLWNPAGVCAGMSSGQPAPHSSHPCCPPPAGSHDQHNSDAASCVCIDRQTAVPVLPSLSDSGLRLTVSPVPMDASVELWSEKTEAPDRVPISPQDPVITFHQILI